MTPAEPTLTVKGGRLRRVALAVQAVSLSLGALAYLATLVDRLPAFLVRAVPSSDTISAPLLAQALGSPGHGTVYLGNHAGYSDLLLSALALRLPDQALSSQAVTYAVYALGLLLLAATVRRLAGWRGACIAGLVSMAATPALLVTETSPTGRVTSLANLVLLGWLATALFGRSRWRPAVLGAAALGVGVVTGVDAASDPLFVVTGILPFLGTGLVLGLRYRDRPSATLAIGTAAVLVAAAASALLTLAVARAVPLQTQPNPVSLASLREVAHTLHILGGDTGVVLGGMFSTLGTGFMTYIEVGVGLLVCTAVVAALVTAGCSVVGQRPQTTRDRGGLAHLVFWALVALTDLAAFLATSYALDLSALRFLTPLVLAFAALLPLLGRRRPLGRVVVAVGVAALAGANAWALATVRLPAPVQETPLVQTLEATGISHAYADYWDANVITWATKGRVDVRSVTECGDGGTRLCPRLVNAATGWFRPSPGPVAVIVDQRFSVTRPPSPTYGTPQRVIHVGNITIFVYDHDLRLTPSP